MSIKVEKILSFEDGEHRFHFESSSKGIGLDLKDFEGHDVFDQPVVADVILNKVNHVYYVKLHAASEAHFLCDRCLEDVQRRVEGDFEIVFSDLRQAGDGETEIRSIDPHKENEVVLDKDICDTLLLSVPTKVLCRENCRGLCVECGADLNHTVCAHAAVAMNH
jgi:uncharacterized protein